MIFPQNTLSFYEMILFVRLSKEVVHLFAACTWFFLLRRFLLWRLEFGRNLFEQFLLLYFQASHTDWLKILPTKSSFMTSWIWDFSRRLNLRSCLNQRWGFTWVFLQNLLLQHLKLGKSFTIFVNTFPLLFVIFTRTNFKIHIVVLFCFDHYLRAAYFFLIRATNLIWNSKLSST